MTEKIEDDPEFRKARQEKHAAWLKRQRPAHAARGELVRRYLVNPSQWSHGLDLPNWKTPHELWYTGHEAYWAAEVAKADGKAAPDSPDSLPSPTDSLEEPTDSAIVDLAKGGASIRDIASAFNLSVGKVQRALARRKTADASPEPQGARSS